MSRKVGLEEAKQKLFEKHGDSIELIEYRAMKSPAKFRCKKCLHEWPTCAANVINHGTGCIVCSYGDASFRYRFSLEYVIDYIESKNCKYISGDYVNVNSPLQIRFECGHTDHASFGNFRRGARCYKCGRVSCGKKSRLNESDIIKEIEDNGFTFVEFPDGYKGIKSLISYRCSCGHVTSRRMGIFKKNPNCENCCLIDRVMNHKGSKSPSWKGGIEGLNLYLRSFTKKWVIDSFLNTNFLCILSGKKAEVVHHLYPFNYIVKETLAFLNMKPKGQICNYSEDELKIISDKFIEIHNSYGLGVPMTKKSHAIFHKTFGHTHFTPSQFEEFKSRIASGEIKLD